MQPDCQLDYILISTIVDTGAREYMPRSTRAPPNPSPAYPSNLTLSLGEGTKDINNE